jgi:hypothetical protein
MTGAPGFTPGPWSMSDRGDLIRIREESTDAVIATTDDGGHPTDEIFDHETQLANAKAIVAVPKMIGAFRAILACYPRNCNAATIARQALAAAGVETD